MLPLPELSMLPPFSMFPNGAEHSSHQFHISRRKKEARGRKIVPDTESPLWLVHWDDPEGWDGEGGGGGIGMGNTCKSMADSCQCMAKTTTIL